MVIIKKINAERASQMEMFMNKKTKFETSIDMEAIRTRLTRMRTDRKITPKVMCNMLSEHMDNPISENSLRKYENGCENRNFPFRVMVAYSKCFGCSMDSIVFGEVSRYSNSKLKHELENLEKNIKKVIDVLTE